MITKQKIFMCSVSVIFFILFSCGISKEKLEQGIMKSQQEKFDTDSSLKEYGLKIQDVALLKTGSNTYDGIMTVLSEGEKYNISFTVKTDSDSYMWKFDKDSLESFVNRIVRKKIY